MKYFLKETYGKANHAGPKARMDAEKIMLDNGYQEYYLSDGQKNNDLNISTIMEIIKKTNTYEVFKEKEL